MWNEFVTMLLLAFSVVTLILGLFAVYFGSGTSRGIGILLTFLGLVVGFFFVASVFEILVFQPVWELSFILNNIAAVAGAFVGALAGFVIFLWAVLKG